MLEQPTVGTVILCTIPITEQILCTAEGSGMYGTHLGEIQGQPLGVSRRRR
jgi:hypothetical protein